ncbi:MAG: hypothetical protein C4582_14085 [Desulfobacteraceae bacterium]|jgi:8-oxo-dGTP pyrophosphatase MutT (NUDIX family)|nr:MAG: hypothetical protein C4582_14085 [Desulfobacteraceae bacterium]
MKSCNLSDELQKAHFKWDKVLEDPLALCSHISSILQRHALNGRIFPPGAADRPESSAVLFTLGMCQGGESSRPGACLILNKRSERVRQPGDLCFPGGGISPRIDPVISRIISLPLMPLGRWPHWEGLLRERPNQAMRLSLLLATGIREGLEEMGLNPLRIKFLGPLPSQDLVMYKRTIYPLATWVGGQRRFFPNREVEKVIRIPLKDLLKPCFYRRCRMLIRGSTSDFPCYLYKGTDGEEVLWGATFRIVMEFIRIVFQFEAPHMSNLPLVERSLSRDYLRA